MSVLSSKPAVQRGTTSTAHPERVALTRAKTNFPGVRRVCGSLQFVIVPVIFLLLLAAIFLLLLVLLAAIFLLLPAAIFLFLLVFVLLFSILLVVPSFIVFPKFSLFLVHRDLPILNAVLQSGELMFTTIYATATAAHRPH